ncbi:UvrD-helicase domain-containing protein [Mycobacterium sp. 852002-40037_SCH5390672]|uniref:UvrD-helicase domain-containing protein n=1 Tax=Mycobacterium sp. 852002-40037_SCH5390672 TaxID=1834089 RepID=UPI0008054A1E|nr:UvrD-helicase domain-containing protein [Mycobacterium sp. 852002-40037_SCH5390672]OBB91393.1 hypothetical protein A5782_15290 [Mycobacterium sp. 852002-40037_SCH5390672]
MSSRIDAPDTAADRRIREILDLDKLTGFTVAAGAGSGKTTSLVKALAHITKTRGPTLLQRTQRVACITYTEVAAQEIHADLDNDPLATVSTIHSFLWALVKPFHDDIGAWVSKRIDDEIAALQDKQANYTSRTRPQTIEKDAADLERRRHQQSAIPGVSHWQYGIGSDYTRGVLGHTDIIKMVPEMILTRNLLAQLTLRQFPFIFVDESQDTFPEVVECLKHVSSLASGTMCLGFFGDPMQQIYTQGVGAISPEPGWGEVKKPENFRSSKRVLACVNAVRAEGDALQQVPGRPDEQSEGHAYCFILPADDKRSENLDRVRSWLDERSHTGAWTRAAGDGGAKVLMIVHRMAARRLGFDGLYAAFNDHGSGSLSEAFTEGTAWPLTPFRTVILPLCLAAGPGSPTVLAALRNESPPIREARTSGGLQTALSTARSAVAELQSLAGDPAQVTLGQLLRLAVAQQLFEPDPRYSVYLDPDGEHSDVVLDEKTRTVLDVMSQCTLSELTGYYTYIDQESPYSTQHGSKGAEFDRVVVVLDDDEGKFSQYSYDKLFGLKPLSATDLENQSQGKDSAIERTRRLLYVCISRAKESLAIVLFAHDAASAVDAVRNAPIGAYVDIVTPEVLLG